MVPCDGKFTLQMRIVLWARPYRKAPIFLSKLSFCSDIKCRVRPSINDVTIFDFGTRVGHNNVTIVQGIIICVTSLMGDIFIRTTLPSALKNKENFKS